MSVHSFVENKFGKETLTLLKRINTGGTNNKKGSDYENFFAVTKICSLAAERSLEELDHIVVSAQEPSFVDDICVTEERNSRKHNYQAKNSEGATADWSDGTAERFQWQYCIDTEYHGIRDSRQVLLVSHAEKQPANDALIPDHMRHYSSSEHFPYHRSATSLVMRHEPLRASLRRLCKSDSLSAHEAAFKLLLGQWCGNNDGKRSVLDLVKAAKSWSHPELLGGISLPSAEALNVGSPALATDTDVTPPEWLMEVLAAFQMQAPRVESDAFMVTYNHMQARVAHDAPKPSAETLGRLSSGWDVILLLMSIGGENLNGDIK